jgi:nickel/cobalt exporter
MVPSRERKPMTSLRLGLCALLVSPLLFAAGVASAHPMGNFTVSHYAGIRVSADGLRVRYVLDYAEIPAFQERQVIDGRSGLSGGEGPGAAPGLVSGAGRAAGAAVGARAAAHLGAGRWGPAHHAARCGSHGFGGTSQAGRWRKG